MNRSIQRYLYNLLRWKNETITIGKTAVRNLKGYPPVNMGDIATKEKKVRLTPSSKLSFLPLTTTKLYAMIVMNAIQYIEVNIEVCH